MTNNYIMENEINSQGSIIEKLIDKYIKNYCILVTLPLVVKKIVIVASGSSYNAGLMGKYFFENIAKTPCAVEYASEFSNMDNQGFDTDALYIFISQSGSSVDTLYSMQKVKENKIQTLSITNNTDSPIHHLADYKFDLDAGVENAIAATKTFSASVFTLWVIACKIAHNKHIDITKETENIYTVAKSIKETIDKVDNLDYAAKFLSKQKDFSAFGLGINYPLAKEAALKIQETSYINIGVYPMGEFIHGHYALLNKSKVFLTFVTNNCSRAELNLLKKILKSYKTKSVVISDVYEDYDCDILVKIPKTHSRIATILNIIIVIQLLALKVATNLKRNVDNPKGLQKVVDGR